MLFKIPLLFFLSSTFCFGQLTITNNSKYNYTNLYVTPVDSGFKLADYNGEIIGQNILKKKLMANKKVVTNKLDEHVTYKIVLTDTSIKPNGCYQNTAIIHYFKGSSSTLSISNENVDLDFNTDCMEGFSEGRNISVYFINKMDKNIIKIYYSFESDSNLVPFGNLYPWQPIQKSQKKSFNFRRAPDTEPTYLYLKYDTELNGVIESKTATLTFEKNAYMARIVLE